MHVDKPVGIFSGRRHRLDPSGNLDFHNIKDIAATLAILGSSTLAMTGCGKEQQPATEVPGGDEATPADGADAGGEAKCGEGHEGDGHCGDDAAAGGGEASCSAEGGEGEASCSAEDGE